jgi:uroporphyrinogen decarboxylase
MPGTPPITRATRTATPAPVATSRERFVRACHCLPVDRPPLWLMRQAGRALPEYRRLKQDYSFVQLVQTPELAAEVTLQPIRRFGFDAAILFSDILVIPEAMGQPYRFRETGGIAMDFAVQTAADIERLSVEGVAERLGYVDAALRLLRKELGDETALIGFAGSPWTLATFMMEGGSAERYTRALALFREDRTAYFTLAEKLTAAVTAYLKMQIAAGVDALQIFDSHGGHLASGDFQEASGRWIRDIISELPVTSHPGMEPQARGTNRIPVIVFSLGTHGNWPELAATGASVLGVDWQFSLAEARRLIPPQVGIQGNLPPALLASASAETVAREATQLLVEMRDRPGYIFNLGHGVPPDAKLECLESLANTVKNFR